MDEIQLEKLRKELIVFKKWFNKIQNTDFIDLEYIDVYLDYKKSIKESK